MPGSAAPFNFNGLVRHYFMRRGANVADIQVNLVPKHERKAQSHDIAKRVRPRVAAIAERHGAASPWPRCRPARRCCRRWSPRSTARPRRRASLADEVKRIFKETRAWSMSIGTSRPTSPRRRFVIDKEKAALHGISAETISQTLRIAVDGERRSAAPAAREGGREHRAANCRAAAPPRGTAGLRVRSGDANALPEPGARAPPRRRWCRCASW
jgi:multidrug efflux pump subunit AcrB